MLSDESTAVAAGSCVVGTERRLIPDNCMNRAAGGVNNIRKSDEHRIQ
jgi:hypothetical protein